MPINPLVPNNHLDELNSHSVSAKNTDINASDLDPDILSESLVAASKEDRSNASQTLKKSKKDATVNTSPSTTISVDQLLHHHAGAVRPIGSESSRSTGAANLAQELGVRYTPENASDGVSEVKAAVWRDIETTLGA